MRLSELAVKVATEQQITKKAATAIVQQVFDEIAQAMADGQKADIPGFGKFEGPVKKERMGRNPRTGEPIKIPSKRAPRFTAHKVLREKVSA